MALTTTYAQLKADIQTWTEDDSSRLVGVLDRIIAAGADRCQRSLNLDLWVGIAASSIGTSATTIAKPTGAVRVRSIFLPEAGYHLEPRSLAYLQMYGINVTGRPKFFRSRLTDILVAPAADQIYSVQIAYINQLPVLSASNTTNWLTDNAALLLLDACLIEAEILLVAPAQQAIWQSEFDKELALLKQDTRGMEMTDYYALAAEAGAA